MFSGENYEIYMYSNSGWKESHFILHTYVCVKVMSREVVTAKGTNKSVDHPLYS